MLVENVYVLPKRARECKSKGEAWGDTFLAPLQPSATSLLSQPPHVSALPLCASVQNPGAGDPAENRIHITLAFMELTF